MRYYRKPNLFNQVWKVEKISLEVFFWIQKYKNYTENGGEATFIEMELIGTEGHNIIYEAMSQWLPYARDYLKFLGFNTDAG